MHFDKVSHTLGEVTRRALLGDLHFAPGTMSVEKYEQVDRAVAPILAVIASKSSGRGWNWLAHLADELGWALVEAHHGPLRVRSGSQGSAQGVITRDMLESIPMPVPPIPEQERIVELLDAADELRKLRAEADHRT